MGLPKRPGDPARGFADDFEQPHQGKAEHVIRVEVGARPPLHEGQCFSGCIPDVPHPNGTSLAGILDLGGRRNFLSEIPAQVLRRAKIDLAVPKKP